MVTIKTTQEIEIMKDAGVRLRKVVAKLLPIVKPGITTLAIDQKAEELIRENGGESSFKKVRGYEWSTCLPINEQVVHTPPSDRELKEGDILTVDIGLFLKGFHTDYATTFIVGSEKKDPETEKFLKIGEDTLTKAIQKAKKIEYLGEISKLIGKEIYGNGYFIMKELTGHGIGRNLHEDPFIPGYLDKPVEKTFKVREGLAVAIEVIYSKGTEEISYERGGNWSIVTADGSISACFEHTIAFTKNDVMVLT